MVLRFERDVAACLAARCAEADYLEAVPAEPEPFVVRFRHLSGGAAAAREMDPAALDAHQDQIASARCIRRAASDVGKGTR